MTATTTDTYVPEYTEFIGVEYTNTCECGWCPTCETGAWGIGELCEECGTEVEPLGECLGCFEDDMDNLRPYFNMWLDANDSPCGIAVVATGLIWAHPEQAVTVVPAENLRDLRYPSDIASVNSSWTQRWTLQPCTGGMFRVIASHHDAPTGAPVELHPMVGCLTEDGDYYWPGY